MIRPDYILHHLPLEELIDDCQYILEQDQEELKKQLFMYKKSLSSGSKSEENMERWHSRIAHLQNRIEFFSALLGRFQSSDTKCIIAALHQSKREAEKRGNHHVYRFSICFEDEGHPWILIY